MIRTFLYLTLIFVVSSFSFVANAQESALTGGGLFGGLSSEGGLFGSSGQVDKLVPNCTTRNEYNQFTKQYTQNEVCHPYVVMVNNSNQQNTQQKQRRTQQIYTQPIRNKINFNYYTNNSNHNSYRYPISNNSNIYYSDHYYMQPRQPSGYGYAEEYIYEDVNYVQPTVRYVDSVDGYVSEDIYYSQNPSLINWDDNSDVAYLNESVDSGLDSWDTAGYENEDVYNSDDELYLSEDTNSGLSSWSDGYADEDVYVGASGSGYLLEDVYNENLSNIGYENENVYTSDNTSGYIDEDVYTDTSPGSYTSEDIYSVGDGYSVEEAGY